MEKIYLEKTNNTPKIVFDPDNQVFEISGRSIPEDSLGFYRPILDWMAEYAKNPINPTTFSLRLDYFNTSSSKCLLDIFYILEKMQNMGQEVNVNWYYQECDDDMLDSAKDFDEVLDLSFNIIMVEEEKD